jgi:NAD(P)-dependent dehydrogenase (short-subunit alcohol dehydrogenase family)
MTEDAIRGRVAGKVALITGAARARGLGAAAARLFAREGATVVIGDILEDEGCERLSELEALGARALFVRLDITSEPEWARAVGLIIEQFGRLDVLVNNAAVYGITPVQGTTADEWDRIIAVNARGAFLGSKHAVSAMRRAGGGSIVNVCSGAALVGSERGGAYGVSKAAVRLLTKYTAVQHARDGIRANAVHPGPMATDMFAENRFSPEILAAYLARVPLGRLGTVDEVAWGILYLASDEASYVTGSDVVIDGGRTAH